MSLQELLNAQSSDPVVLGSALSIAFLLGAAHALTPGHGKAIVAAYLAGSRGRVSDAVYLGGVVTVTHTAMVFALGIAALYASEHVSPDRIYPWLALISGLLVAAIGVWLLYTRTRAHAHGHHHPHTHAGDRPAKGNLLSLGISGGLAPCPEALVVLLISISIGRLAFGLALLVSFTLGLAAILIGVGIAMVMAGPLVRRLTGESRWLRALPVASAGAVAFLGVVMTLQGLARL